MTEKFFITYFYKIEDSGVIKKRIVNEGYYPKFFRTYEEAKKEIENSLQSYYYQIEKCFIK